ncbi:4-(cytidine 5'-diphospho)-2-C-methyl-D-erythritol kinase [Amylibacter sp.]|nr:4-(cytidine 5'-diphospho)-2-C-methyl-D-erythritol kinase [Amylibacter sp.]
MFNTQIAKAKINLCLHVTGQNTDGYHLLDSLVVFADCGDELTFKRNQNLEIILDGRFSEDLNSIPISENIIFNAAKVLDLSKGAEIFLRKNLPVSAGIGGGSADAAATLRGLAQLWNTSLPIDNGLALGADVPVCIKSTNQRMQGIGEILTDIEIFPKLSAVLINSGDKVSTLRIFKTLKSKYNQDIVSLPKNKLSFIETIHFLSNLRNDLENPAIELVPNIKNVLNVLNSCGSELSRMSGSGGTCFGLFQSFELAQKAAKKISLENPKWWVQPVIMG